MDLLTNRERISRNRMLTKRSYLSQIWIKLVRLLRRCKIRSKKPKVKIRRNPGQISKNSKNQEFSNISRDLMRISLKRSTMMVELKSKERPRNLRSRECKEGPMIRGTRRSSIK